MTIKASKQVKLKQNYTCNKKQVANIIPEVQEIIEETKFAENMMDMVHLSKQTKQVQMEVAKIINEGQAQTYKRAFILANLKLNQNIWTEDKTKLKDECGIPKSIMEFSRKKDKLNDICSLVSRDEKLKITRKTGFIGAGSISIILLLAYGAVYFKMNSRLSKCNLHIEELINLYASPDIDSILAKDASRAKELFDSLNKNNCKANEFVKPKYTELYNLLSL